MDAEYAKKRLEKDLVELKRMIDDHFKQRQEDEAELSALQDRIEKRKAVRTCFLWGQTVFQMYLKSVS